MTSLQCGGSAGVALVGKLGIAGPCGRRSTPGRLDSDLGLTTPAGHLRLAAAAAAATLDSMAAAAATLDSMAAAVAALDSVAAAALDGVAAAATALAGGAAPGFGGRHRAAAVLRHDDASVTIYYNCKDQKNKQEPKKTEYGRICFAIC